MSVRFTCWDFRCFQSWRMKQSVYCAEIIDIFFLLLLVDSRCLWVVDSDFFFFVFIRNLCVFVLLSFIFSFLRDQTVGKSFFFLKKNIFIYKFQNYLDLKNLILSCLVCCFHISIRISFLNNYGFNLNSIIILDALCKFMNYEALSNFHFSDQPLFYQ